MIELSDRETATLILFALVVAVVLLMPKVRRSVVPAFVGVLRALTAWKLLVTFGRTSRGQQV